MVLEMAIGTGTDVAIETSDIILSSGNLKGIPSAIAVSRQTMCQNLFLTFANNIILIPVAALAMAMSSIPVVRIA